MRDLETSPDIIANAQQLLDGSTPAPWVTGGKDESGNIYIGNPSGDGNLVATSGICDAELIAAAPELAQALAEETWEYSAQAKRGENWETCTNSETHLEEWWAGKGDAEWAANRLQEQGRKTRLVRRRVSSPEVINE